MYCLQHVLSKLSRVKRHSCRMITRFSVFTDRVFVVKIDFAVGIVFRLRAAFTWAGHSCSECNINISIR